MIQLNGMSEFINASFLVFLGFSTSLIWLLLYLREDAHPEPKKIIVKVFLMGIIVAPLAVIAQYLVMDSGIKPPTASFFLIAALIEEIVKLLAVAAIVLWKPEFDEPVDAMIYLVVAALGFAAIENILMLFKTHPNSGTIIAIQVLGLRFVGATFLHTLASSLMGYFLAMSWFHDRHKMKLIIFGILIATAFHFAFNFLLVSLEPQKAFIITSIALMAIAVLILCLFHKLRSRRGLFGS